MVRRPHDHSDNQLRSFIRIARTGSIHEASRTLGISQPALSKQMKKLEASIGVELLRRTNKGIVLTEVGDVLFRQIQPLYDDIDNLLANSASSSSEIAGSIVMGVVETFSRLDAVWGAISTFTAMNRDVSIVLNTDYSDSICSHVLSGHYDIGIVHENSLKIGNLNRFILSREPLNIVYNYSHFDEDSIAQFPDWEHSIPMVNFDLDSSLGRLTAHYSKKFDIPITLEVNSLGYMEEALFRGLGVAILPASFSLRADVSAATKRFTSPLLTTLRGSMLIEREHGATTVAARKFMETLQQYLDIPNDRLPN